MSALRVGCPATRERTLPPLRVRDDLNALAHRAAAGDERAWSLLVGRLEATLNTVTRRFRLTHGHRERPEGSSATRWVAGESTTTPSKRRSSACLSW